MPSRCFLDQFPVELLYAVFSYLSADEILYSFLDISRYLNGVLANYHQYYVNFESILKPRFDLICQRIHRPGIIALTLSDGSETPHQSKEFFTRVPIEEFAEHVRSLTLSDLDVESVPLIEDRWTLFSNLTSLSLNNTLPVRTGNLPLLFCRLIRLKLTDGIMLNGDVRLDSLKHLTITNRCSANQLRRILCSSTKLVSCQVRLNHEDSLTLNEPILNLKRLTLDMSGKLCETRLVF